MVNDEPPINFNREKVRNKMDTAMVTQIIGSLGFPIVACIGLGWYLVKVQKQNNDTISKMSDALNNNTIALTKLAEKIDASEGK
jgi:hypothetical protein